MNQTEQNSQIIKKYKRHYTFYALSIVIPWSLWLFSAYLSHKEPYTPAIEWATGLTSFAGLLAPVIIALCFILPDKELKS